MGSSYKSYKELLFTLVKCGFFFYATWSKTLWHNLMLDLCNTIKCMQFLTDSVILKSTFYVKEHKSINQILFRVF